MKHIHLLLIGTAAFCLSFSAQANDDDLPPYEEICDQLNDATPGLYGLCNAFCLAQPPGDSGTFDLTDSQVKILRAYNRKKTYDDPDMPCFQGCPCFSVEDAAYVATHENFFRCADYYQTGKPVRYYESWKEIIQLGEIDQIGTAQNSTNVTTYESDPGWLHCDWSFRSVSPNRELQRHWSSFYEEDRAKFEDCQAIIDHVVNSKGLECETFPECESRIVIDRVRIDDLTLNINGMLINEPDDECVNRSPFARVEWYWGDGTVDEFETMQDGYIYPFPNSHTYDDYGLYTWKIYAFDSKGKIVGIAGSFILIL